MLNLITYVHFIDFSCIFIYVLVQAPKLIEHEKILFFIIIYLRRYSNDGTKCGY